MCTLLSMHNWITVYFVTVINFLISGLKSCQRLVTKIANIDYNSDLLKTKVDSFKSKKIWNIVSQTVINLNPFEIIQCLSMRNVNVCKK